MKKFVSRLQYLTQDLENRSHIEQAQTACEAGCKWIQYRCFSKTDEEMIADLQQIASICDDWGVTLIVTDHTHLLEVADIQGVHIEDMDADFTSIRNTIGDEKTLGASANTFEQIQRIADSGVVDYIGCGPFEITETKPNDYPLLGVEGYRTISKKMAEANIKIPVVAVGGITVEDIDAIMQTGVAGIAISAAVNKADNPAKALKEIYKKIH